MLLSLLRRVMKPPPRMTPAEWAEKFRRMSTKESAFVGRFSFGLNPYFRWFLTELQRRDVTRGVCKKSAQVGWTQAVILNLLGWLIHIRKGTTIVMFPKAAAAQNFNLEKFEPMVEGTPELAAIIPTGRRNKDNKQLFKNFVGGFIKFVGSNSIADVKSTSARNLVIEEPDDCNLNLRGQGNAITLLEERGKSYRDAKLLIGGTPSIKGISAIDTEFERSSQHYWHVPCPDCDEFQVLVWDQVRWSKADSETDPLYGRHQPETARYCCAHCGSLWTNDQKNAAIRKGKPVAHAEFRGILGLALNELYSLMHNSRMSELVGKFVQAHQKLKAGDPGEMIVFHNATLGLSWEFKFRQSSPDDLRERGLDYPPMTVPRGGLVITAGVDVQHNRLAVVMRAWGRGEESWLVQWTEIDGNPLDLAPHDADGTPRTTVWDKLDALLFSPIRHADGFYMQVSAVSIDAGDGTTSDAVYSWVRKQRYREGVRVMAVRGARSPIAEIFAKPKAPIDTDYRNTKSSKYGLRVYEVGVSKAKDLLIGAEGRITLTGFGPGRMHFTRHVRQDYCEQLLSERKVPKRQSSGQYAVNELVWQRLAGVRNEVLDCENYNLHAARSLKLHTRTEAQWAQLEADLRQDGLFADPPAMTAPAPAKPAINDSPDDEYEPVVSSFLE